METQAQRKNDLRQRLPRSPRHPRARRWNTPPAVPRAPMLAALRPAPWRSRPGGKGVVCHQVVPTVHGTGSQSVASGGPGLQGGQGAWAPRQTQQLNFYFWTRKALLHLRERGAGVRDAVCFKGAAGAGPK